MPVTIVAAVAGNGIIGNDGDIPWRLPADFAHFKALTMGGVLIMGRRTYESIGRPLPGRTTIVLTRDSAWTAGKNAAQVLVRPDLPAALATARDSLAGQSDPAIFVVGGAEVYAAALPIADEMVLSEIDAEPVGDTYFPAFDALGWLAVQRRPEAGFTVVTYRRESAGDEPSARTSDPDTRSGRAAPR